VFPDSVVSPESGSGTELIVLVVSTVLPDVPAVEKELSEFDVELEELPGLTLIGEIVLVRESSVLGDIEIAVLPEFLAEPEELLARRWILDLVPL